MPTDASPVDAIGILLTALGLSSVSGLRAYFPLLAAAIGSDLPAANNGHLITLAKPFQQLGNPAILTILAALTIGEFFVDKIPVVDHLSDAVHTVIRPAAGAALMAGISNPLSEQSPWLAALVGAGLSLAVHGVKASARPVVTATTIGHGNPVVSLGEDVVAALATILALTVPILAFILMTVLTLGIGRWALRRARRRKQKKAARAAARAARVGQVPVAAQQAQAAGAARIAPVTPVPVAAPVPALAPPAAPYPAAQAVPSPVAPPPSPPLAPTQTLGSTTQNAPTVPNTGDQSQWIWPADPNAPTWPSSSH